MSTFAETKEADDRPRDDRVAMGYGVAALLVACVPIGFFVSGLDEGPRGAWAFADAKQWVGLARFALASLIGIAPVFWLVKQGRDRAEHALAALPAVLALFLAMPMIPGAVIQLLWWFAG